MKCLKGQRIKDYFLLENGDKVHLYRLQDIREYALAYILVDNDVVIKVLYI